MNEFSALEASTGQAARTLENRRLDNLRQGFTGEGFGRNSRAASYFFPENYTTIFHYITFTALKFESVTRTSTINSDSPITSNRVQSLSRALTTITLPMSDQLQTRYGASYTDSDVSATGEVAASAASNINPEEIRRTYDQQGSIAALAQTGQQAGGGAISGALIADLAGRIGSTAGAAGAANIAGIARNPQKVVLFSGVGFRDHSFTFKLTPRNRREADMIQKIITAFKIHMLPKYGLGKANQALQGLQIPGVSQDVISQAGATSRAFFEYPDVFDIRFRNESRLFKIGESVLKDLTVDYHPQNYPAYVRSLSSPGDSAPASITISLTFQETDILTKEQIIENKR